MSTTFALYSHKLEFTNPQEEYNKVRLHYKELAIKCADRYMSDYYEKYDGMDGFSKHGFEGGWKVIGEALEDTIQLCVDSQKYDVDENSFLEQFGEDCFSDWIEAYNGINDQYMEIVLKTEEMDEYRTQRRQGRGRIIGGGFGLGGAVKGMVAAGSVNMATGALHAAFNTVGKGFSSIGDYTKKSNLYKNKETKHILWQGIYQSIFNIHSALCHILNIPVISDSDIKRADTLFNNIGRMRQEDIIDNIVEILLLNPYKYSVYEYCIDAFGDEQREVQAIAEFVGLDLEEYKNNCIKEICEKLNLSNEQNALKAKEILQNAMDKYGLQSSEMLNKINKKLEVFDQQARIVDGVTFATREEASLATNELAQIKLLMKQANIGTSQGVTELLTILAQEEYSTSVKNKYVAELEEKRIAIHKKEFQQIIKQGNTTTVEGISDILNTVKDEKNYTGPYYEQEINKLQQKKDKLDIEIRTVGKTQYEDKEQAEKARLEVDQFNKIVKKGKTKTAADALSTLEQLKMENLETKSATEKIAKIEKKYNALDEKERTVSGRVYDTQEEVKAARNKARRIPIAVFIVSVGLLTALVSASNVSSLVGNLFFALLFVWAPWTIFMLIKPEPATFYITKSRVKGLVSFLVILIVLFIAVAFS